MKPLVPTTRSKAAVSSSRRAACWRSRVTKGTGSGIRSRLRGCGKRSGLFARLRRTLEQRVDDLPGAGVPFAGRQQRVDVAPADGFLHRAYRNPLVVVDQETRHPADPESAEDQPARGERVGGGRHHARLEPDVAAGLDEEALG